MVQNFIQFSSNHRLWRWLSGDGIVLKHCLPLFTDVVGILRLIILLFIILLYLSVYWIHRPDPDMHPLLSKKFPDFFKFINGRAIESHKAKHIRYYQHNIEEFGNGSISMNMKIWFTDQLSTLMFDM